MNEATKYPGSVKAADPVNFRRNHVNIIIGKRSSGKTVFTTRLIKRSYNKVLILDQVDNDHYRHIRIVAPQMIRAWKSGTIRIIGSDIDFAVNEICDHVTNAFIIFEDATRYIRSYLPDNLRALIADTKQKNIDLVFTFHGFGMVMPDLYRLADSLTIFKTNENISEYKNKIPNFSAVKKVYGQVMRSPDPYYKKTILIN